MKFRTLSLLSATVLGFALFCQNAQAIPITGSVDMSGSANLNNVLLGSATGTTSIGPVVVGTSPTGSFVGTAGSAASWSNFGWNPATTPVTPLWTFVSGLWTYSFDLSTVSVVTQNNNFLNLMGTGVLKILGLGSPYTATAGAWSFTVSNPTGVGHDNFSFTFANSQTAVGNPTPEGGLTIAFLGSALLGLGILRRRLS